MTWSNLEWHHELSLVTCPTFKIIQWADSSVDVSIVLPDIKMIISRASYIRASTREILTIEDLRHWSKSRFIADKSAFDKLLQSSNDMIILDTFDMDYVDENCVHHKSLGFVFSNTSLLNKMKEFIANNGKNGLSVTTDGTAKLVVGSWILSVLGTQAVVRKSVSSTCKQMFTQSCLPFLYGSTDLHPVSFFLF